MTNFLESTPIESWLNDKKPITPIDPQERTQERESIRKQELLADKIENDPLNYWLDNIYKWMNKNQRITFIKNLLNTGIDPNNFNVGWARCTTLTIKWTDWNIISASIGYINSGWISINFPSTASCGNPNNPPSMDKFLSVFNSLNRFPSSTDILSSMGLKKLISQVIATPAKQFLENWDKKLYDQAIDSFAELPTIIKQNILDKIKFLYEKQFPLDLNWATVGELRTEHLNAEKNFRVREMRFTFWE